MSTSDNPTAPDARLDPASTALIVVDVQNDFAHPDGYLGKLGVDVESGAKAIQRIGDVIGWARSAGAKVMFLQEVFAERTSQDNLIAQYGSWDAVIAEGTWGAELHEDLVTPAPDEPVIIKRHYDAFCDTEFDLLLRTAGVKTLVFTGVSTNVCVESTARHGFVKGYHIFVVDDCCFAPSPAEHEASLHNIRMYFGSVIDSADLARAWSSSPTAG